MRRTLLPVVAGLSLMAASGAHAQGYVGGGAGWARIGVDCSGAEELGASCDKTGTGGKFYGGFRVADQLAVELAYFNWGKAKGAAELEVPVDTVTPSSLRKRALATATVLGSAKLEAEGFGIGVAYFMPFAKEWTGVARLGVASNRGKLSVNAASGGETFADSASKRGAFPYLGVGIGYQMTPKVGITGEVDLSRVKYGFSGAKYGLDDMTEKDSVQLVTLGMRFAF